MNFVQRSWDLFRQHWRLFTGIHLCANLFVAAVLGPLLSLSLQLLILGLGEQALTDQAILFAFLSPSGFALFTVGIALMISVAVFESAALMLAACRLRQSASVSIWRLGRYLVSRFPEIFRLAVSITLRAVLWSAPFLALAGWLFLRYLTEYDINYYLSNHPPELYRVGGAIGIILLVWFVTLLRLLTGWIISLPLLLLGGRAPRPALAESARLTAPARRRVFGFLLSWTLLAGALLLATGAFLDVGGNVITVVAGRSLHTLAWLAGALFLTWSVINFAVSLFLGTSFVLGMLELYEDLARGRGQELARFDRRSADPGFGSWALLALGLIVVGAGFTLREQLDAAGRDAEPEIFAHRGASFDAPENTLAAIEEAIAQGAGWAEIDVQETATGEVVVIHDRDLMKVGGVSLRVHDTPLETLREVDIGSYRDPRFADQRMPLFAEVLELARGRIRLNVELKYYGQEQRLEERVAELIEAHGMQQDVVLMSLSLPGVRAMKALRPDWEVGLLSSVAVGDVTRLDVDFFAVNARFANRKFIERAQARGRKVLAWTVNDPAGMSAMASRGVDGIITDRPGLAREVLDQRAGLDPHERLLVALASFLGSDFGEEL